MFRHVVLFRWSPDAGSPAREAAVAALQEWAVQARDYGTVRAGTDAGLKEGNWDVAVVAEFADQAGYEGYAADSRHLQMIASHITPNVAARAAVQSRL